MNSGNFFALIEFAFLLCRRLEILAGKQRYDFEINVLCKKLLTLHKIEWSTKFIPIIHKRYKFVKQQIE